MAVMFQVEVFWVWILCSVVEGYQHFRGPCCFHLQGEPEPQTIQCHNPEDLSLEVFFIYLKITFSKKLQWLVLKNPTFKNICW
jgi:hypothetical protein